MEANDLVPILERFNSSPSADADWYRHAVINLYTIRFQNHFQNKFPGELITIWIT